MNAKTHYYKLACERYFRLDAISQEFNGERQITSESIDILQDNLETDKEVLESLSN